MLRSAGLEGFSAERENLGAGEGAQERRRYDGAVFVGEHLHVKDNRAARGETKAFGRPGHDRRDRSGPRFFADGRCAMRGSSQGRAVRRHEAARIERPASIARQQ